MPFLVEVLHHLVHDLDAPVLVAFDLLPFVQLFIVAGSHQLASLLPGSIDVGGELVAGEVRQFRSGSTNGVQPQTKRSISPEMLAS